MSDFLTGVGLATDLNLTVGVGFAFKLLVFVVLTMYVFYAFLLTLRVRILADTVEVGPNKFVQFAIYLHMIIAMVGSFIAFIISLLA